MEAKPRSNSPFLLGAFVLIFGLQALFSYVMGKQLSTTRYALTIGSFSLIFFAEALASLRSGYLWKNLQPGNRGQHRSENPRRFAAVVGIHFAIGASIVILALLAYLRASG